MTELDIYNEQMARGILTLQHRYRELGRLRCGEQRTSRNGKRYPAKLDTFRFTSTDWRLIARAAELYGGKPETWADAPDWNHEKQTGVRQFQVTVEADRILVSVPAQQQVTQSMEYWTGGGCQRRCNGVAMTTGEPCECRAEMEAGSAQLCQHVTRANFVLPNIPGLGVWRLESKGVFTASELPLQLTMAARYGPDVEWWLRLDPRRYRTTDDDGKPITYHFHVPVLDTDHTPAELYQLQASYMAAAAPAIQARGQMNESSRQPSDPGAPPALPATLPGPDLTSEAGDSTPRAEGPASDLNASATGPGDTDASAGQEPPNAEASTSPSPPASPGDGGDHKSGRGRRSVTGEGRPADAPAGPHQGTSERGHATEDNRSVKRAGLAVPAEGAGEGAADPSLLPELHGWER